MKEPKTQASLIEDTGNNSQAPAFTRQQLLAKGPTPGPLLLIDPEATAYIPPNWTATADKTGAITATQPA